MAHFTGKVARDEISSSLVLHNDNGAKTQRLTTAAVGEDFGKSAIDLRPYAGRYIRVEGTEQNDWIVNAQILDSADEPFPDVPSAAE